MYNEHICTFFWPVDVTHCKVNEVSAFMGNINNHQMNGISWMKVFENCGTSLGFCIYVHTYSMFFYFIEEHLFNCFLDIFLYHSIAKNLENFQRQYIPQNINAILPISKNEHLTNIKQIASDNEDKSQHLCLLSSIELFVQLYIKQEGRWPEEAEH